MPIHISLINIHKESFDGTGKASSEPLMNLAKPGDERGHWGRAKKKGPKRIPTGPNRSVDNAVGGRRRCKHNCPIEEPPCSGRRHQGPRSTSASGRLIKNWHEEIISHLEMPFEWRRLLVSFHSSFYRLYFYKALIVDATVWIIKRSIIGQMAPPSSFYYFLIRCLGWIYRCLFRINYWRIDAAIAGYRSIHR